MTGFKNKNAGHFPSMGAQLSPSFWAIKFHKAGLVTATPRKVKDEKCKQTDRHFCVVFSPKHNEKKVTAIQ